MSDSAKLTPHEQAKRLHDVLTEQLRRHGEKSPLLQHLKKEHPDIYAGLVSECKTHGPSIKGKITDFVQDSTKALPAERMSGVQKALKIIEEKPYLVTKSHAAWWVAGIVAAVGVGAYFINEYGKPKKKKIEPKSGDWKDRVDAPTTTSEARSL